MEHIDLHVTLWLHAAVNKTAEEREWVTQVNLEENISETWA